MKKQAKKFNWLTTLRRLAKRKTPITEREHYQLRRRASDWPTCACGQLCKALPRSRGGVPQDDDLSSLGCLFAGDVGAQDWTDALATFLKIEARTTLLLKQMAEAGKAAA